MFRLRTIILFTKLLLLVLLIAATAGIVLLLESKEVIYTYSLEPSTTSTVEPFPVSVNTVTQEILDNPAVETFYMDTLAQSNRSQDRWWNQVAAVFSSQTWWQNLASPVSRIVVVWPGQRKEEVANEVGDILRWNSSQRDEFQELITSEVPALEEGKFFPGQYVTHRYATPADVAELLLSEFDAQIQDRYTEDVSRHVQLEDALIIASLLEREASDFTNMREVSGVIWNRLFIDMPLQLDATLQYVRGSDPAEPKWWPAVRPQDKFLDSPYNTYAETGLPPQPIANPTPEAVLAALNPVNTDCYYYFHGPDRQYYCSVTYEEHVEKLRAVYGQGR